MLGQATLVCDGATGTMLQRSDVAAEDFQGLPGCNEVLNATRPDAVAAVHRAYLAAGADCVETNTFGANLTALGEYDATDRIGELALAGARIARAVADEFADRPRFVLGSLGPGTKLPTLGQTSYRALRDGYQAAAEGLVAGGVDAFMLETCQDLLQARAAVNGAKLANRAAGADLPIFVSVTLETTGQLLLGSELGAALAALAALDVAMVGLNCGTGPEAMGSHLRWLARHSPVPLSVMPNAGLPVLGAEGAVYPLGPADFAAAVAGFAADFPLALVGGCCGTTPSHIAELAARVRSQPQPPTPPRQPLDAVSSLYTDVPLRRGDSAAEYLIIGERTNANGSKAFREAMLERRWDDCLEIARRQSQDGAHLLDLCVDYVGRDGAADMAELAGRLATGVTLPIMLDSTSPEVLRAGLERLPGRCVVNSVNYEDGGRRLNEVMALAKEHGAAVVALAIDEQGQARTAEWKLRVAERLIDELTGRWGLSIGDVIVDCLTFPIGTGQEETRRDAAETIAAIRELNRRHPGVGTTLGVSNVSFGLKPAARAVLNSVFLDECLAAGLSSAIVHPSRILPLARVAPEQREAALALIYDRREAGRDPLADFLALFADGAAGEFAQTSADALDGLDAHQRLAKRVVRGLRKGLEDDIAEALRDRAALDIVNQDLLGGMREVGELFGAGRMQLPFVLASAEVMKQAVALLEPHMPAGGSVGLGTIVLATVAGDVHDIGKNLVDIILSNNGYRVVNLGIKQPLEAIAEAAVAHQADAIGMSGLLVKSTQVMADNLAELDARGLGRIPVLLGGAALTRPFVEETLNDRFSGEVRYAKDAFEGLELMGQIMAGGLRPARGRRVPERARSEAKPARSDVSRGEPVPRPPFWGTKVLRGAPLSEVAAWLDERALFQGQWGLRGEYDARPRLRHWLDELRTRHLADFQAVYGYWPCHSQGDELVLLDPDGGGEAARFAFPRQAGGRGLCLADFFRDADEAARLGPDVVALQAVTLGEALSRATAELFAADAYRDYLELHGVGVQLTEAMAEWCHALIRRELGFHDEGTLSDMLHHQAYQGSRYSFGYPACPDLEQRAVLAELLDISRVGLTLSEQHQLHPELATDAIVVHHREAKYFNAR
ncbi:MAG: methionine synthase [Propionibacteriaceae bacterium]|jgi:5-methyltetrahydrofolate--homocysteine methyltransferase|nr:methionine synthase [Propionibacteriaceae bacterium]